MAKALIVVDVQNDFCPDGSLAVDGGDKVASLISGYMAEHTGEYVAIVASMCWHPDAAEFEHFSDEPNFDTTWPPHCIAGTVGAEMHPNLDTQFIRHYFKKGQTSAAYSAFEGTNEFGEKLYSYLHDREITAVDVVGIATDYCVKATAIDAAELGLETMVYLDLCAAVSSDAVPDVSQDLVNAGVAIAELT